MRAVLQDLDLPWPALRGRGHEAAVPDRGDERAAPVPGLLDQGGHVVVVNAHRVLFDVSEHDVKAGVLQGKGRGDERERGDYGDAAVRHQGTGRQLQGGGAAVDGCGVQPRARMVPLILNILSELLFESLRLRSLTPPSGAQHALDSLD